MQKYTPISVVYQSNNPKHESSKEEQRKSVHNDFINFVHGARCYCIYSRCCEILLQINKVQLLVAGSCNGAINCGIVTIFSPEETTVGRCRLHTGQCDGQLRCQSSWREDDDWMVADSESCRLFGCTGKFQIGDRKGETFPPRHEVDQIFRCHLDDKKNVSELM